MEGAQRWRAVLDTPIGPGRPAGISVFRDGDEISRRDPRHTLRRRRPDNSRITKNEIAQSEAITGKPFARFWLHSEFLNVDAQKMAKSAGNFYTLRDLLAMGYAPEAVRYLLLSVPYRKKLNFTFDGFAGRGDFHRPPAQFQTAPGYRQVCRGHE